eukprot:1823448-Pleurochrysis_carterae.AAC.3
MSRFASPRSPRVVSARRRPRARSRWTTSRPQPSPTRASRATECLTTPRGTRRQSAAPPGAGPSGAQSTVSQPHSRA